MRSALTALMSARLGEEGRPGGGVDLEVERGGETHGAQEAQAVLAETRGGVADGAQDARGEVGPTADEVDHLVGNGVEEHAVDGEIAAFGVAPGRGEGDIDGAAAVDVDAVGAEAGDLELRLAIQDADDTEVRADGDCAREQRLHLLGAGAGGDVEVVRGDAAELVAHAAAREVGDVARPLQTGGDGAGGGFHCHRSVL